MQIPWRVVVPWLFGVGATAQAVPDGFVVETVVASGLDHPTDFCFLPDGRCLIANRSGLLSLAVGPSTPVVGIGTIQVVNEWFSPTGTPSIAADPGFAQNGYIYVLHGLPGRVELDRYTCTGALANPTSTTLQLQPTSRHVLLDSIPDSFGVSTCSSVRFGPDGMLYVATDDDASGCGAQQLLARHGCLLRLDVSQRPPGGNLNAPPYSALDPGNNPFSANTDFSQLVLGIGLRAPSRLEIDPLTGNLYVGDVAYLLAHEVSEYVMPTTGPLPFVNFGWPWFEGAVPASGCGGPTPAGLHVPIFQWPASGLASFTVSGPRYRNQQGPYSFGVAYEGDVFYADHTTGEIRRLVQNGTWQPAPPVAGQPTPQAWATGFQGLISVRLGPDGALWILQQQLVQSGLLRRIRTPGTMVWPISGDGQRVPAGEQFPQPLVVRVFDALGNVVPGAPVNFTLQGGGSLSTTNPVLADAVGFAQTTVTSTFGGAVTVTATALDSVPTPPFRLFGRRLSTSLAGNLFFVQIDNETAAMPPFVPYIVMLAFPGSPTLLTPIGPLCVDPTYALAVVFEDGVGTFGGISVSGTGALGMPGLYKQYTLPPGLLTGQFLRFQAVGVDSVSGWFRTNCAMRQF